MTRLQKVIKQNYLEQPPQLKQILKLNFFILPTHSNIPRIGITREDMFGINIITRLLENWNRKVKNSNAPKRLIEICPFIVG